MSFCEPQSIDDYYRDPPTGQPPVDVVGSVPPRTTATTADIHDKNIQGSLPSTREQVAKALADMRRVTGGVVNVKTDDLIRSAEVVDLTNEVLKQETAATVANFQQNVADLRSTLAPLIAAYDRAIAGAEAGQTTASDLFNKYKVGYAPLADIVNRLTKQQLSLSDLTGVADAMDSWILGIAANTAGVSPKQLADWKEWREKSLLPTLQGVQDVYAIASGGSVDVGEFAGNLVDAFSRSLGEGTDREADTVKEIKAMRKWVADQSAKLDEISEAIATATELVGAAQTMLLAACQMLNALVSLVKNIAWLMQNLPFLLATLLTNLINNITGPKLWFRLPRPIGTFLGNVDGLVNRLVGFEEVGRCFRNIGVDPDDPGFEKAQSFDPANSRGAAEQFMAKISELATASLASVVAKILGLNWVMDVRGLLDPSKASWIPKPRNGQLKVPRPIVLPEEGNLLAFMNSAGVIVGFILGLLGAKFKPGSSDLLAEDLYQNGVDETTGRTTTTPVAPHPGKTIANMCVATKEGLGQMIAGFDLAEGANDVAGALREGVSGDEATQRASMSRMVGALQKGGLAVNLALDEHLKNPSPAAADYLACRAASAASSHGRVLTEAEVTAEFQKLGSAPNGLPSSIMAIAAGNNPSFAGSRPETLLAALPTAALPAGTVDDEHLAYLAGFTNLAATRDLELLPFYMLQRTRSERDDFGRLLHLHGLLEAIIQDQVKLKAHANLLREAHRQGRRTHSPYTWLAEGVLVVLEMSIDELLEITRLGRPIDTSRYQSLVERLHAFLRHQKTPDLRPLATWLASARDVDKSVPIPTMTFTEEQAAQESFAYIRDKGSQPALISDLILAMRKRADDMGRILGYEYVVGISFVMLLTRYKTAIADVAVPEPEARTSAIAAKNLLPYLERRAMFEPMLEALTAED